MAQDAPSRADRIRAAAEAMFGQAVTEISAPGGSGRSSLRFHFGDRTIIGTLRPNFRRTHLEAYVLRALEPHCDDVPRVLGVDGEVMFQTDVGNRRLNLALFEAAPEPRADLAAEAVAGILRIHAAARKTTLAEALPVLGNNPQWVANLVNGTRLLKTWGGPLPARFDRQAVMSLLRQTGRQVVKWDCRSGNAALGDDGRLRWFDFEYAGVRHGAEDLAWFIADESVAVPAPVLWSMVEEALTDDVPGGRAAYLNYLAVFTALHSLQRLALILDEAEDRGWLTVRRILERDDVGVHPAMAAHLCRVGGEAAMHSPLTAMLTGHFHAAAEHFDRMIDTARAVRAQAGPQPSTGTPQRS